MKPDPNIFIHAAEIIDDNVNQFACHAIGLALGDGEYGDDHDEVRFFVAAMKPRNEIEAGDAAFEAVPNSNGSIRYWCQTTQFYGHTTPENQTARILGLLLCAELAEEGYIP